MLLSRNTPAARLLPLPTMRTCELDYHLPDDLLATHAADPRDAARLMVCDRKSGQVSHHHVRDLPTIEGGPKAGDLLVFNQTRVLPACFTATRKATGGKVAGLYLASEDGDVWRVMLESRGKLQPDEIITLADDAELHLIESRGRGEWRAQVKSQVETLTLLERIGTTPLPPYIRKARRAAGEAEVTDDDAVRYNTVYAAAAGSVAAPTAGLHFTPALLEQLTANGVGLAYVTLHVGLGTFAPIRTDVVEEHPIHSEWIAVPAATRLALADTRKRGGRVIPVGTTTVRALESLPAEDAGAGDDFATDTDLYITPDRVAAGAFAFRFTDCLMTNFHLPQSTLLALVGAMPQVGMPTLMQWYQEAIAQRYRFYSYGDAMIVI